MKFIYNLLVVIVMFLITGYCVSVFNIYKHENIHYQVYRQFNIDSAIVYSDSRLSGTTIPNVNESNKYEMAKYQSAVPYQAMAEIMGYNITIIIAAIMMCAFLISLAVILPRST